MRETEKKKTKSLQSSLSRMHREDSHTQPFKKQKIKFSPWVDFKSIFSEVMRLEGRLMNTLTNCLSETQYEINLDTLK